MSKVSIGGIAMAIMCCTFFYQGISIAVIGKYNPAICTEASGWMRNKIAGSTFARLNQGSSCRIHYMETFRIIVSTGRI